MILIFFILSTTLMCMFLLFENGTPVEYSSGIYGTLSSAGSVFLIATFIWKTKPVYKLMADFEENICKREVFLEFRDLI